MSLPAAIFRGADPAYQAGLTAWTPLAPCDLIEGRLGKGSHPAGLSRIPGANGLSRRMAWTSYSLGDEKA